MSRHRDMKEAQRRVNERVAGVLQAEDETCSTSWRTATALGGLRTAWRDFDQLRRNFDGDAPASARDTSIAAAKKNLPLKGSMRRTIVLTIVAHYCEHRTGMTCAKVEARLRRTHQSVSSAVNWAETAGWIRDSGARELTPSNAKAIVWEPTEAAVAAIKEAGLV